MYSIQWFWSPWLYFPWSGKVEQESMIDIDMQAIEDALRMLRETNLAQFLQSRERLLLLLAPPPDDTTPMLKQAQCLIPP